MKYKIIVDKQSRTNPSNEKRIYEIDIEELRRKGDVYDSLVITKDEDYVMRRLSLSEYHVLKILDEPVKQPLEGINIELFEGDNYIYLVDMTGNKFYAEYLVKNDFTDLYVTVNEMNSAINQTAGQIELTVNQKLTSYATNEDVEGEVTELNSKITQTASEITSTVSKTYATKGELNTAKSEIKQTTDGITSTVSSKAGKTEVCSIVSQSAEEISLKGNRVTVDADNFKLDKKGNMTCTNATVSGTITSSNATITGGKIKVSGGRSAADLIRVENSASSGEFSYIQPVGAGFVGSSGRIDIMAQGGTSNISSIDVSGSGGNTRIYNTGIETPRLTQTSVKSKKKYIRKLKNSALDLIKNSDICLYNLKSEQKGAKQHIRSCNRRRL